MTQTDLIDAITESFEKHPATVWANSDHVNETLEAQRNEEKGWGNE